MKETNPQEILNEILLRMNYDSSMTLSENRDVLLEQNTYYYDNAGNLQGGGPVQVPANARMASKLYPNLNPSQYPKKITSIPTQTARTNQTNQTTQVPTINRDIKYQQLLRNYNLPFDLENKKNAKSIIANSLASGEYEEFMNKLKTIYPEFSKKLVPVVPEKPKSRPKVDTRSYSDATRVAPGTFGTPQKPLSSKEEINVAKFFIPKKIDVGFDNEFEVPGTSTLYYWNENDQKNLESFSKSVTFKDGSSNDWAFFLSSGNQYQKNYVMPIGKVKGFSFDYKGRSFTFKRSVTSEEFLNEFGTILNGKYLKFDVFDYLKPTFWQDWGPTILNMASIAVAVLGPPTWALLLTSAGLDVTAANLQYRQGDIEGAKLSALLALTPFLGKFAIKVPKAEADALARKFVGASTESEINQIVSGLSEPELKTLQSLQELGDIKKVQNMVNDPEVKAAINKEAKNIKGISKKTLQRAGIELSSAGLALASKWKDITEQELSNMSRKELLKETINLISEFTKNNKLNELAKNVAQTTKDSIIFELRNEINKVKERAKKSQKEDEVKGAELYNNFLNFFEEETNLNEKVGEDSSTIINQINNIGETLIK